MSPFVGASLLAMDANDKAGNLKPRGVLRLFASKLAPTGMVINDNAAHLTCRGVLRLFASKLAPARAIRQAQICKGRTI